MSSKEDYAKWIVANKDKKGTPEFETVAKAYSELSAEPKSDFSQINKYMGQGEVRGITNTTGAPVDLMNTALSAVDRLTGALGPVPKLASDRPAFGSDYLGSGAANLGLTYNDISEVPADYRGAAIAGETLTEGTLMSALPFLKAGKLPRRPMKPDKGFAAPIVRFAADKPGRYALTEGISNLAASAGGAVAEELYPGNQVARMIGEATSGAVPGFAPLGGLTGVAGKYYRDIPGVAEAGKKINDKLPLRSLRELAMSPEYRMARRVQKTGQGISGDKSWSDDMVARLDAEAENFPPGTSAGTITGDESMLALEASFARSDKEFATKLDKARRNTVRGYENDIRKATAGGDVAEARRLVKERAKFFETEMQAYTDRALETARNSFEQAGPTVKRADASRKMTETLEDGLEDARNIESEFWSDKNIPRDIPLQPAGTRASFDETHQAWLEGENIPRPLEQFIRDLYVPQKKSTTGLLDQFGQKIDKTTDASLKNVTSGDLLRIRSRALMLARAERSSSSPDWDLHHRLMGLADGSLEDLADVPGVTAARDFSRSLNKNYTQGPVGKLLRFGPGGDRALHPEEMLNAALGKGGISGDVAGRAVESAASAGKRPISEGGLPGVTARTTMPEQEEWLRNLAYDTQGRFVGTKTRFINEKSGQQFMVNNQEMISRHPKFAQAMERALKDEAKAKRVSAKSEKALDVIDKGSPIYRFLEADDPVVGMTSILEGNTPLTDFHSLVKTARRSGPGALDGLRDVTMEYVLAKGFKPDGSISIEAMSDALMREIKTPEGTKSLLGIMTKEMVMTKTQRHQLMSLLRRGEKIQTALKSGNQLNEIFQEADVASMLAARWSGANIGGASVAGAGTPLVMAHAMSQTMRNLIDKIPKAKAADIFKEAVFDPVKYRNLLTKVASPTVPKALERQMNAYLLQTLVPVPTGE